MKIKKSDYGIKFFGRKDTKIGYDYERYNDCGFAKVLATKLMNYLSENTSIFKDMCCVFGYNSAENIRENYEEYLNNPRKFSNHFLNILENSVLGVSTDVVPIHQIFQIKDTDIKNILPYIEEAIHLEDSHDVDFGLNYNEYDEDLQYEIYIESPNMNKKLFKMLIKSIKNPDKYSTGDYKLRKFSLILNMEDIDSSLLPQLQIDMYTKGSYNEVGDIKELRLTAINISIFVKNNSKAKQPVQKVSFMYFPQDKK